MFKRILVPLDGSFRAEQALSVAAHIAQVTGASIQVLRVAQIFTDYEWQIVGSGGVSVEFDSILEREKNEANAYLENVQKQAVLQHIPVTTQMIEGDPARSILGISQSSETDLIVMSSHGYTGIRHWLLGSVAEKVAHYSAIPVLVLRDETITTLLKLERTPRPVRVMVALDGSPLAESSLEAAALLSIALSQPAPGVLHLARVLPPMFTEGKVVINNEQAIEEAQRYLLSIEERLSKEYDTTKLTVTSSVSLNVDIAGSLIELAETGQGMEPDENGAKGYDIICIATHGRGGIERWLMGSIAERVLSMTKLPLLIVRPPHIKPHDVVGHEKTQHTHHIQVESAANAL